MSRSLPPARGLHTAAWAVLVTFAAVFGGCESTRYARALRTDSVQGYRRFLAEHPEGDRANRIRRRLEDAVYRQAKRSRRPIGYHLYLQEFAKGRYGDRAREALARLALRRARTPAGLELVLERHPSSAQAREAERRLAEILADRALAARQPAAAERFLERFAGHRRTGAVREHLARLRFSTVRRDVDALERFLDRFKGTAVSARAERLLADRMAELVEATHDRALLAELSVRFPAHPRLAGIRRRVNGARIARALSALDPEALAELAAVKGGPPGIARLHKVCASKPRTCDRARGLARGARRFSPPGSVKSWAERLRSPDPLDGWRAMAALSYLPRRAAGQHLAALLSDSRLGVLWPAERGLRRWLSRMPPLARSRWLSRMTARAPHPANLDDLQRHGFLLSLGDASRAGQRGLESLMHRPKRGLAAAYLLVVTQSPRPAERVVKRLLATARARLRWLQQTFPVPLRRDGLAAGLLAERELFATSQVLQALLATAGQRGGRPGATATLLRRCRGLLLQWRDQLRAVSPGFVPATAVDLIAEATRHEGGRAAAWRQLTRLRDLPARAAALGVCHQVGGGQATGAAAVASDCPRLLRRDRKLDTSLFGPGGGGSAR